jgi:hypothetical protein
MSDATAGISQDRSSEWFVPKFGPRKFQFMVGLLFLPYTAMVLSFVVIGSVLAGDIFWGRLGALLIVYSLGLGVAAHALDALGSKQSKPWGNVFSRSQLWRVATGSLATAYLIATYYMVRHVPLLWVIAILEGFFVFSYNLEWFHGRFHTDRWFAFSWGFLPVLAGYIMQTNRLSVEAVMMAMSMAFFSYIEIKASRPYKDLKRKSAVLSETEEVLMRRFEAILKSVSSGVILFGVGLLIWRAHV